MAQSLSHVESASRPNRLGRSASIAVAASVLALIALAPPGNEVQAAGPDKTSAGGSVCFQDADYEAGWYHDYEPGACFTRTELARRAGQMSDNTAGHMLVRDVGGPDVLNAWAASVGTKESVFFTNNTTSAND